MYIYDQLRQNYSYSAENSLEYTLSRYLLMNFERIPQLSLTDISIETGISKSSISRFIKTITNGGSYPIFIDIILLELQTPFIHIDHMLSNIEQLEKEVPSLKEHVHLQQIKEIADCLMKHQKIYLLGQSVTESNLSFLVFYLIKLKKDVRLIYDFSILERLQEEEMAIILAPEWNLYDFLIQSTLCGDVNIDMNSIQGDIYFIGNTSKETQKFKLFTLDNYKSESMNHLLLEYAAYLISLELSRK